LVAKDRVLREILHLFYMRKMKELTNDKDLQKLERFLSIYTSEREKKKSLSTLGLQKIVCCDPTAQVLSVFLFIFISYFSFASEFDGLSA